MGRVNNSLMVRVSLCTGSHLSPRLQNGMPVRKGVQNGRPWYSEVITRIPMFYYYILLSPKSYILNLGYLSGEQVAHNTNFG